MNQPIARDLIVGFPNVERVRLVTLLRHGPMTIAAIAQNLEAKADTVEKALKRSTYTFVSIDGHPDRVVRWALKSPRMGAA